MNNISFELFRELTVYFEKREPTREEYEEYVKWQQENQNDDKQNS